MGESQVERITGGGTKLTLHIEGRGIAAPKTTTSGGVLPENFTSLSSDQQAAILRDLHAQSQAAAIEKGRQTFVHPRIRGKRG